MLATITAFTIAHSITLGLTIFEVFSLPRRPTEVIIALSVFLLAVEAGRQGEAKKEGEGEAELWHSPWLFALACGLLHGLGFAEGLKAVGLPPTDRAWALLQFNLGIEAGQVLVVAAALAATHLTLRAAPKRAQGLRQALVYGIGATAAYWLLERVSVLGT